MTTKQETTSAPTGIKAPRRDATLQIFMESVEMTHRLRTALLDFVAKFGNIRLDEVRPRDIDRIRNAGPMTCTEFGEKQRQYLLASIAMPEPTTSLDAEGGIISCEL